MQHFRHFEENVVNPLLSIWFARKFNAFELNIREQQSFARIVRAKPPCQKACHRRMYLTDAVEIDGNVPLVDTGEGATETVFALTAAVPDPDTAIDVAAFLAEAPLPPFEDRRTAHLDAGRMARALGSADQATYHWDIATDRITWSSNVRDLLGLDANQLATGRQFAAYLDSENFTSRYDTVLRSSKRDGGAGVKYEIEYRFLPLGKHQDHAIWIEDSGCWFGNTEHGPREAYGTMRLANERHQRDQELQYLSNCDPLTGMMNRARMADALGEAISVATTNKNPCAFAIVAVNNLDVMNEAYGYEVADEVIVALGQRLRHVMRVGDGIARYSGSKFGVILNGCKPDELNAALERFMRAVRDSVIETKMGPVWALLSIGAISLPALGNNAQTAIAHAEEALSEAFRLPGDGYVVYTSSEERRARRLLNARCATEIVSCLRDGLFKLAFQPIIDIKSGEVIMHEALLRMADTTGALITAGHLVPIAERLGLIRLIDRAVLQLALQTLQSYPDAKLSVNISATTVVDPRWNAQLLEMIAAAPEPASRLVLEITETASLADITTSNAFATSLRDLGCGVALDDFGAGYTSYRNLKELPLSHIKLDGSFCTNLASGGDNHVFVKSMVDLSHAFGLLVIAEWVETEADAQILQSLGVDCLQGNLFGEPSIAAPWDARNDANFQLVSNSLAPVESTYFEANIPEIETPRSFDEPSAELTDTANMPDSTPQFISQPEHAPAQASIDDTITVLDDAELDAEIEALARTEANENNIELEVAPAWETALQARDVQEPLPEEPFDDAALDDNLAQLRAALSELNSVFKSEPESADRLAS
jgi:diguanylate cyclase (GGDEF)-like protein